jgi:hypothetical protein
MFTSDFIIDSNSLAILAQAISREEIWILVSNNFSGMLGIHGPYFPTARSKLVVLSFDIYCNHLCSCKTNKQHF